MAARVAALLLLLLAPAWSLLAPAVSGAPAPADTGRFPALARLLLLPDEQALVQELKDEGDRATFQAVFWARRDPTPATPANEFEDATRASWARADELFAMPNQRGSETGCGQLLALLGAPEFVEGFDAAGRLVPDAATRVRFDNLRDVREGARRAEVWTYRNRPDRPYSFTRAEARIQLDSDCRFDEAGILLQDLRRAAESKVVRREIAYRRGTDGRLVPPAAATAGAGARGLLAAPRADFPLSAEPKLVMRAPRGEAYVAGLLRAAAGAAGAPASVSVAAQALGANGQPAAEAAREVTATPEPDGSLVASWGLSLKPGRYSINVAALLPQSGQGSAAAIEVEVPDFASGALAASPLVLYPDEPAAAPAAAVDPRDPYAAMQLGSRRIRPRFGNVFVPGESLTVVAALYGARPDAASGRAALRARYSILKDGKPIARGAEDAFATVDAVASVGPIALATYAPGAYVVRLDVTDTVAQQTLRQEAPFEVRAGAARP